MICLTRIACLSAEIKIGRAYIALTDVDHMGDEEINERYVKGVLLSIFWPVERLAGDGRCTCGHEVLLLSQAAGL